MTGNPFFGKNSLKAFTEASVVINTPEHEKRMNELHHTSYIPPRQRTRRRVIHR